MPERKCRHDHNESLGEEQEAMVRFPGAKDPLAEGHIRPVGGTQVKNG